MSFPPAPKQPEPQDPVTSQWQAPNASAQPEQVAPSSPQIPTQPEGFGSPSSPSAPGTSSSLPGYSQAPGYAGAPHPGYSQAPGYAGAPHPGYSQAPGYGAPQATQLYTPPVSAPMPGIIPLRPLSISDLFNGSFLALRGNPGVMFGFTMALFGIVAVFSALGAGFLTAFAPDPSLQGDELFDSIGAFLTSTVLVVILQSIVIFIVGAIINGVLSLTVSDAVIGRKTDAASAWQRVRPRLFTLLGFSLVTTFVYAFYFLIIGVLIFIPLYMTYGDFESFGFAFLVTVLIFLAALPLPIFFMIRIMYAPTVITLENQGVLTSIKRSFVLTKGNFFPTFGRFLVLQFAINVASGIVNVLASQLLLIALAFLPEGPAAAVAQFISLMIVGLVIPLSSAYVTLMYVDRRIRVEGLAQTLLRASGS